jgi:hypothetical protein
MPEYALLLFAVLISAAAATKRIGPRVAFAGDTTRRILMGEDIEANNTGTAIGGMVLGASGSSNSGSANGSSRSASSAGGSSSVAAASGGGSLGGATTDFLGGSSSGSGASASSASGGSGGGSGSGSSVSSNVAAAGGGILNGGGVVLGATGSQPASSGATSGGVSGGENTAEGFFGSSAPSPANAQSASTEAPRGFLGGTGAPAFASQSSASGASQNTVNPAPSSASSEGTTQGDGYTISAQGEKQMQALLAQAKENADGKKPLGKCYHVVKTDIDEVGYGDLAKSGNSAFPKQIPSCDQEYAHQFADYMNAKGANGQTNASNLGLQKLPITNPYDAPPGSIIVVRAGTPGTRNPVAGDIVVAGGGGKFYNDGNMGYGGSKNFPAGNNYVLGIYAPK